MQTHVVPVGFDYDRIIAPLVRDQMDVDRVVLLEGAIGSEANVEYSLNLAEKLEGDFRNLLGATTERAQLPDVYDYDAAFEQAYELIRAELDRTGPGDDGADGRDGGGDAGGVDADGAAGDRDDEKPEVWVNVSSMPRPVSFAFATAAHSIMVERPEERDRLHTYYTAPEKYLETELAEKLRRGIDLVEATLDGETRSDADDWLAGATQLIEEFDERGTTVGAKEFGGSHVIELPVASFSSVEPFEELILFLLGEHGEFDSVSALAEALAAELGEEYTDSFRSKVIYNVDRLGPGGKGYIEQERHGNSHRTRLSRIGELWVRAHAEEEPSAIDD